MEGPFRFCALGPAALLVLAILASVGSSGPPLNVSPDILSEQAVGPAVADPPADPTWASVSRNNNPPRRQGASFAYDSESDRLVMFGGGGSTWSLDDTWAYDIDSDTWAAMAPVTRPGTRASTVSAYDSESDRVIVFGGYRYTHSAGWEFFGDTWSYDLNTDTWTNLEPPGSPSARTGHRMAYDSLSDRVVLFGGSGGDSTGATETSLETWAFDLNSNLWTRMDPAVYPGRLGSLSYDAASDRVVYFGGDETWTYDLETNTWTKKSPVSGPPFRGGAHLAYDAQSDRVILFGGSATWGGAYDTWSYDTDTDTWTRKWSIVTPDPRQTAAFAFDAGSDRAVLFGGHRGGGLTDETWSYDLDADAWEKKNPARRPIAPYGQMSYDSLVDRVLVLTYNGAVDSSPETWSYDAETNTWELRRGEGAPGRRFGFAMAYDSQSQKTILFGGPGIDPSMPGETWAYDFQSDRWSRRSPAVSPSARYGHALTYDELADRVILFGGGTGASYFSDRWAYDFESDSWTYLGSSLAPAGRQDHTLVYDRESDRTILFGGTVGGDETWSFHYGSNLWTRVESATRPPPRSDHGMVYDDARSRMLVFGGFALVPPGNAAEPLDDTWAFDSRLSTWTKLTSAVNPPAQGGHFMAYDRSSDRAVLFSVGTDRVTYEGTWWIIPQAGNTPAGLRVPVRIADPSDPSIQVDVVFEEVIGPGSTSLVAGPAGPEPPPGSVSGDPARYYTLNTTALYVEGLSLCIDFGGVAFPWPPDVRMFRHDGSAWTELPTSLDPVNAVGCGRASGLSVFALFQAPPNLMPEIIWLADVEPAIPGQEVALSLEIQDPERDPVAFSISWGDGLIEEGVLLTGDGRVDTRHAYTVPGLYPATVRAEDSRGDVRVVFRTVGVDRPALLRVVTTPAVQAKILIDGVPADEWGLNWVKVLPGSHTVSFGDVYGHAVPEPVEILAVSGESAVAVGAYIALGSLQVTTSPALPVTISINGQVANDWGVWRYVAPGTYRVSFGLVAGYDPPKPVEVSIGAGEAVHLEGIFRAKAGAPGPDPGSYGMLRVTTDPAVPAQVVVDGIPRDEWGLNWVKIPPGTYEVSFAGFYGLTPPAAQSVVVEAERTTEAVGRFLSHGSLRVITDPPLPATIFVNGIPRNDWGMWQSMEPGAYRVSFGPVPGFRTAGAVDVTIAAGQLVVVTGRYVTGSSVTSSSETSAEVTPFGIRLDSYESSPRLGVTLAAVPRVLDANFRKWPRPPYAGP